MLTVTEEDYAADVAEEQEHTARRWAFRIDERIDFLPSVITVPQTDLFMEWVYIIDLDREVFEVRCANGELRHWLVDVRGIEEWNAVLRMDGEAVEEEEAEQKKEEAAKKLKEHKEEKNGGDDGEGHQMDGVAEDDRGHGKDDGEKGSKGSCDRGQAPPELTDATSSLQTSSHAELARKPLLTAYKELKATQVLAKCTLDLNSDFTHDHILRAFLFNHFWKVYAINLIAEQLGWCASDFGFREVVFAMVSLASGTYYLQAKTQLLGDLGEGYCWKPKSTGGHQVLPAFAKGCHAPGVEAGSAPSDTVYWFNNVVVCLDDCFGPDDSCEVDIARAVDFGRRAGRDVFDGLIVSLTNVVLLRYDSKEGVKHTSRIRLAAAQPPVTEDSSHLAEAKSKIKNGTEPVTQALNSPGFNAMIHLFDGAARQRLKPSTVNSQRLPLEVCHLILELIDDDTYRTCSRVSRNFRAYTQKNLRLGGHVIRKFLAPTAVKISDTVTGTEITSTLESVRTLPHDRTARVSTPTWFPVLYDAFSSRSESRPSIIENNGLLFRGLSCPPGSHAPPEPHQGRRIRDALLFGASHHSLGPSTTAAQTCHGWNQLLRPVVGRTCSLGTQSHVFKLPPNTQTISVYRFFKDYKSREPGIAVRLWIRKPADLKVEGRYEMALGEAEENLRRKFPDTPLVLGMVFGHWVRYYDWKGLGDGSDKEASLVERDGGKMFTMEDESERKKVLKVFEEISESTMVE